MPDIFEVVADPTRRALLQVLRDRLDTRVSAVAVADFVEATGVTRQSVNRHLAILADAALLTVTDDGPHRTYALDASALAPLEEWIGQFVGLAEHPVGAAATAFSAWSGADVGETVGRTLAERAFQARTAAATAKKTVQSTVKKRTGRG
ncbi:hypothetical protein BH11ACT2_BH11ACT2_15540 [soil metagenome]